MPVRSRRCIWGVCFSKGYFVKITGNIGIIYMPGRYKANVDPRVRRPAYNWYRKLHEDLDRGTIKEVTALQSDFIVLFPIGGKGFFYLYRRLRQIGGK
jgi:hypothetical protein